MPLLRYFLFVGGALLVLLFICDAVVPQVPLPVNLTSGSDLPAVRIHSDRKWPERVVFDTSVPSVAPSAVVAAVAAPAAPPTRDASAKARVREAFAQLPPGQSEAKVAEPKASEFKASGPKTAAMAAVEPGKAEVKPKRKVARAHPAGRPVMLVAQQPHYGLFDTTW